jgi:Uma2 family endonuclease
MAVQPKLSPSFDDWLAGERAALESRSEYLAGQVFAMTGASEPHNAVVRNILGTLWTQMKGRPCHVYASDMKVRVRSADAGCYPDLVALCGEREYADGRRDVLLNPTLIVEVLSASTEAYDRGAKFGLYREIESLQEYLLVSQHRAQVEHYSRGHDNTWTLRDYRALTDTIVLSSLGCTLSLAEVYEKVDLTGT